MSNGTVTVMERECETCGTWLEFDDHTTLVHCSECQCDYIVNADAEFVDGPLARFDLISQTGGQMIAVKDLPEGFILSVRAKDGEGSSFVVPTTAWALMALGFGDKAISSHPDLGSTVVRVTLKEWDKIMEVPF